jgi:nitrogen fixation NifU-like protein
LYSEKVMEHFSSPHNMGELKGANAIGEVGNAKCGDIMRMYLKIEDGMIRNASFKTFGCCAAIASSSVTTDMVKGKSVEEALSLKNSDVINELDGLPPVKVHCSVLAEEAIRKAIENYKERNK